MDSFSTGAESLFGSYRAETPPPRFKRPIVRWEVSGPVYVITDAMGVTHEITDGGTLKDARIEEYDLSGLLWHRVCLESVSLVRCRLVNFEIQHSELRQVLIDDCVGGFVWNECQISDAVVRGCGDETGVVRFFRSSIKTLTIAELSGGLELTRCHGEDITISNSRLTKPTLFRLSTFSSFRIISSEICGGDFSNTTMLGAQLVDVYFKNGSWREVEMSSSVLRNIDFDHIRIEGLRLDLCELELIKLQNAHANDVTSTWSSWESVQIQGGVSEFVLESCTIQSMNWYRVVASVSMIRTKALGVRLIEVFARICGQDTCLWRPVIRRSVLDGDGVCGITVWGADMSSTQVTTLFGYFIEP